MKKLLLILSCILLIFSLVACNGNKDNGENENGNGSETPGNVETPGESESPEEPETPDNSGALNESEWNKVVSKDNFDNYTVKLVGKMTVTENGVSAGESDMEQEIKVTANKMTIELFFEGESIYIDAIEGDMLESQKVQASQLFILLLSKFDNFVYDADEDVYKLAEAITINTTLKGITYTPDGQMIEFDVPAVIEMRDAKVTLSEEGKLEFFTCDYTQTMNMEGGNVVSTSGLTTWTFSNFGTTVIE